MHRPQLVLLLLLLPMVVVAQRRMGPSSTTNITPSIARALLQAGFEQAMTTGNDEDGSVVATADDAPFSSSSSSSAAAASFTPRLEKTEANSTCIMEYCQDAALNCVKNKECRTALNCLSACDEIEDDTPDKINLQKCTADCVITYENQALDDVNACFDSHECITLEPIPLACRDTAGAAVPSGSGPKWNVTAMEGEWWATWGFNPIYDCYLCQRLTFSPLSSSSWLYDSKYVTPTLDNTYRAYELQAAFPWPADGMASEISFNYTYQGMSHGETWKFLHVDPTVVILYYCGFGNTWHYEGGLVLSRERSSPPEHLAMATEAFAHLGVNVQDKFCELQPNAPCPGF